MDIEPSNAIKLFFPNPSLLQVFFEAIANSLDAQASEVAIKIEIECFTAPKTLKITIRDDGTGFTDKNFERFSSLLKPKDAFHKGVGRLIFLNYFDSVAIDSIWGTNKRQFVFGKSFKGDNQMKKLDSPQPNLTTLTFTNFIRERINSYVFLKPSALKQHIIDHFLPTLHERRLTNQEFRISIDLQVTKNNTQREFFSNDETITKTDLPELTLVEIKDPMLDAFEGIQMFYRIKNEMGKHSLLTAVSIDGRTIPIKLIQPKAVPVDHSGIFLFFSKLFRSTADTSRQKLILPESISEPDVLRILRREVGAIFSEKIPQIAERNDQTKERFEK